VEYNIQGFRGKNKSEISLDLVKGIMASSNELLHLVFLVLVGKEKDRKAEELEKLKKPSKSDKFLGAKFRVQMK
jgi:myosin heavy subunit